MIGAKLSDQRNSRNAGRFKSTNQRLAYRGSPAAVFTPLKSARGSQTLIGRALIKVRAMSAKIIY